MSTSSTSSADMQNDGGQSPQQQTTNVNAATSIIGALPTGQPVTGQQAIDAAAAHDRELADLRLQNQQLQQSQQQIQQQLQQLLLNQQQSIAATTAANQHQPASTPAQPAVRVRELKLPEPHEYRGSRDRQPIRDRLRDIEELFTMGSIPISDPTSITYAAHYLRDDAKTW